ncbi:WcbI family polysaccharide biosynthesis putative acetyltransferase [Sphingomonas morindae]|uniref:Polysaccharide biosynthesis enzyme WcbI domain-containing protein n=1 Tax=Sphingomonas morindae TaxID=1541170 RepID=A0ABY4X636_9SPHN|nr:WcbI family polysaccharide biosynthesis putative acetyltransferase [Sphingomonas morindae]USI72357.1 hypothetical protein LHA26_13805 [Sphingomonas morindae]
MPSAVVIGNCQAQLIEAILIEHTDWAITRLPPVFEMTEAHRAEVTALAASSDFVFAQRVTDSYPLDFVRTSSLKQRAHCCISWPNAYFAGYFPDIEYVYLDEIGKLVGPMDDYHSMFVLNAYRNGLTAFETTARWRSDAYLDVYPNAIEASLAALKERENGLDIIISDFIANNLSHRKLFYTPNHPINDVLLELAARLIDKADGSRLRERHCTYSLSRIHLPLHPAVAQFGGLRHLQAGSFVGIDRPVLGRPLEHAPTRVYIDDREIIEAFFRFYDSVPDLQRETAS